MRLKPGGEEVVSNILGCGRVRAHTLLANPRVYLISPAPGTILVGEPFLPGACLVHQFAAEGSRGAVIRDASRKAIEWLFRNTDCEKIVGLTPARNRPACMMAAIVGLEREGILKRARREEGTMEDVVIFGLQKHEWEGRHG